MVTLERLHTCESHARLEIFRRSRFETGRPVMKRADQFQIWSEVLNRVVTYILLTHLPHEQRHGHPLTFPCFLLQLDGGTAMRKEHNTSKCYSSTASLAI